MSKPLTDAEVAELREAVAAHFYADLPLPDLESLALRLLDELERARALLRKVEWSYNCGQNSYECPGCDREKAPHAPDCELAALIGK